MKKSTIVTSLTFTLKQDLDIHNESNYVLMNFGPVRAGLTSLQRTQDQQLSELLSSLERKIEILQSKYLEAFATSRSDTTTPLVPLYDFTLDTDGIS